MAITRRSPFIPAIVARHAGQRLRWSSIRVRRLLPSPPFRYARKSGRNSAQPAPAAFVTSSQTRARAASSVPASTSSCLISCSARSRRSSDIADLPFPADRRSRQSFEHVALRASCPAPFASVLACSFARLRCAQTGTGAPATHGRRSQIVVFFLAFHFGLQPLPDPMEPDGYVVLLQLEHPGQLFDSTAPRRDAAGTSVASSLSRVAMARRSCSFSSEGGWTAACGARSSYTDSA